MGFKAIAYNKKTLKLHKAAVDPDFEGKTILVNDPWDYVEMWMKRNGGHSNEALFYWQQAKYFFQATEQLPKVSSPLTAYYCFLNATKSLLTFKNIQFSDHHGVSGTTENKRISLSNEKVNFKGSGILHSLCSYLNEPCQNDEYSLRSLLYNLPYIHRAYCLTFKSDKELFIPVFNPIFVKKNQSSYS